MSSCDGVRLIADGELPGHRATSPTLHAVSLRLPEVLHLSHRQAAIMSALTAFNLDWSLFVSEQAFPYSGFRSARCCGNNINFLLLRQHGFLLARAS